MSQTVFQSALYDNNYLSNHCSGLYLYERPVNYQLSQPGWAVISMYTRWLKQQILISHSCGGWEVQGQAVSMVRFLVRALFLACRCCLPFMSSCGPSSVLARGGGSVSTLHSLRSLSLHVITARPALMISLNFYCLSQAWSPNTVILRVGGFSI